MSSHTINSVNRATRRAATPRYLIGAALAAAWVGLFADATYELLPDRTHSTLGWFLTFASIVVGRWWLVGGEILYKAFCAGRAAEREAEKHRPPAGGDTECK